MVEVLADVVVSAFSALYTCNERALLIRDGSGFGMLLIQDDKERGGGRRADGPI